VDDREHRILLEVDVMVSDERVLDDVVENVVPCARQSLMTSL